MKLKRILVANRGEIARRVFRTIKELGMDAIAMHSEADRTSLFVKEADESFLLPNGYLDQEAIINKDMAKERASAKSRDAYEAVRFAPIHGPTPMAPELEAKPSSASLLLGLGQTGLQAHKDWKEFNAEDV